MTDAWFEVAFGEYYPEIYGHRDEAEALACLNLLPTLAPLNCRNLPVLDLGCGDGRHLAFQEKSGFKTIGLDLSAQLLKIASERPHSSPLIRGDMRCLPIADNSLGAVLSLFTAFGYFGSLKDNAGMIQDVARTITPGGHWFLDYFNCDRVKRELGSGDKFVRERTTRRFKITEIRQYSAAEEVVTKEVHLENLSDSETMVELPVGGLRYTERVAVFSLAEIDKSAGEHGLVRVASASTYHGGSLDGGNRWILVYRKEV